MPANSRVFLKPFIGGLNTEGSDTDDMVLNTSDELNCTILPEQMRGRRYGFNIERDGKWIDSDVKDNLTGSVYYWKNVSKTDLDILVCRLGDTLYFFDAAVKPISDSSPLGSISLKEYIIDVNNFYKEKFGFAEGDGKLTVVNRWMQPVRIIYNVDPDATEEERFVVESFTLSIRDIEGVVDSWGVKSGAKLIQEGNEEPTKDVTDPSWTITDSATSARYIPYCDADGDCYLIPKRSGLSKKIKIGPLDKESVGTETHVFSDDIDIGVYQTGNDIYGGSREHYYNLLNQGWDNGDLDKFKQAMTTSGITSIWPDNTMAVNVGRDNTGAYNTGDVVYTYLGNTQQPRGHFILDYFKMNRSEVSGIWDFKNAAKAMYSYQNTWVKNRSIRGVMITNHSTTVADSQGVATRIVLKWTKLYRKSAKKSWDLHWRGNIEVSVYGLLNNEWTLVTPTRQFYSDDGASSTDPLTCTIEIDPGDNPTNYEQYRVDVRYYNGNGTSDYPQPLGVTLAINIFTTDNDTGDYFSKQGDSSRITDIAYMSGKYFYLCKDSVLFSQTVREDGTGFDLCYQEADPTSTEVSDVVTTDGGYVKFNTMGRGVALKTFNRGVLVFGRDIVYGLISPLESRFTATDYDILELSRAGLASAESVVSTTQQVYYWSPTGIYTIGVNPETGSTIFAQSVSLNTIQTFYNNLPQFSKEHCKGVYDYTTNRIYWYYPTDEEKLNNLDGCLVYDLTYNCFMPQNVSESEGYFTLDAAEVSQSYEIEPTYYLRAGGVRVVAGGDKVLVSDETSTDYHRWTSVQHLIAKRVEDGYQFSIGDFNDREFHDWEFKDYGSYLVSRPITLGDTYFNKQTPVMQTLFKRTEEYKLKKLKGDASITAYNIDGISDVQGTHVRTNQSWLYNSGKVEEASVTLDLTNYTAGSQIDTIEATVYGLDSNGASTAVAHCELSLTDDISGTKYIATIPVVNANDFESFHMESQVGGSSATMNKAVPTTYNIVLKRSDLTQPIFKGFKEHYVSGDGVMEAVAVGSNNYRLTFNAPKGIFKSATVDIKPFYLSISQYFSPSWSASVVGLRAGVNEATIGVGDSVDMQHGDYTVTGTNTYNFNYYDQYSVVVNNIVLTAGASLHFIETSYNATILVPDYEEFSYYEPGDYTTPSGAIIRMRWGWSVNPLSNRWDMMQNGYRPQKDFMHDDYVESRLHVRGRGKAFQVEIRNEGNKDFRLTGLNIITRSPQ